MQLFDSALKEKIPLNEEKINLYLCGPTVYDDAHLGHARSSVCFDLLRRVLLALGRRVSFARNYTDIDDKILKKMQESGQSLEQVSEFYIASYERDMRALRVMEPDFKPRATHFIKAMISLIENLQKRDFAYVLEDGIYFDVSKDADYFSLSKRQSEENLSRLSGNSAKKNASDFVLWKFDAAFYEAPFGRGRPGWHTECVAMIESLFEDGLDIHAGGADLLFPHHENEAAQCRCAWGKNLAKSWLHNGFVKMHGEKMSKSLNNSFFLKDALREFHGEVLRFYLLGTHYRAHFNYSRPDLMAAKRRLDKFYRLKKRLNLAGFDEDFAGLSAPISGQILACLSDDLNISKALALLDEFLNSANAALDKEPKNKALKQDLTGSLQELASIFGFGFLSGEDYFQWGVSKERREGIEARILQRAEAKKNRDFQRADALRAELAAEGIVLLDTPQGVVWEVDDEA
ncbi:cysteine--tRNA ligase [Campylobacter sp.]|uniref:cysteine--tRNA ligase n=1 Tax=Campylobacter sp. TaxID=205 RepID=UPI0026DB7266|nr:cysteine--tRNA ligase [Campylobacter sp.]MDO4673768.1 cysteine--tRNA ligase [Campylobacter sp.]